MIISRSVLTTMRNVSDKIVQKVKTHILCSNPTFFYKNCAVYEIMWKNIIELDRPRRAIWRMRIACDLAKATDTLSEYVMFCLLDRAFSIMKTKINQQNAKINPG